MKLRTCLLLCFLACNSAVLTAQTSSATITQSGWYRIAINGPLVYGSGTSAGGNRAAAQFILKDITSALHQTVEFLGYVHYGKRPSIAVLNNSYYAADAPPFQKLRILQGGTYDGAAIEVYVYKTSVHDNSVADSIEDNFQVSGWTPVNWQLVTTSSGDNDGIPAGFSARIINLTNLVQGYVTDGGKQESFFNGNFYASGNVGIGTETPQSRLAVNGTVTAKQVTVTQNGWPDYVFDPSYTLPSLDSVRSFISHHHHLPALPSAAEIESKGLDIGDMQKRQMQQIEELVLYLSEEQETIRYLKETVAEQNKRIEALEKQSVLTQTQR